MSDIELAVRRSKRLEALLERKLGAHGRGLHEKVSSVESELAPATVRRLRFIATIRNKIVHEEDYDAIDDRRGFVAACREAERELGGRRGAGAWLLVAAVLVAAAAAWWWLR